MKISFVKFNSGHSFLKNHHKRNVNISTKNHNQYSIGISLESADFSEHVLYSGQKQISPSSISKFGKFEKIHLFFWTFISLNFLFIHMIYLVIA
jgi:hypothetical protein